MKWLKPLLASAVSLALFLALNFKHGDVPPLGKLLNPFAGFWQNNASRDAILTTQQLPELQAPVEIVWDDRRVAHVFAQNAHDLYFAQGYLTARDRLWQMEFQTHAAAGRLAEIVGPRALEHDRYRRRIGMIYAAENALKAMQEDEASRIVVEAYTAGVNAWIQNLSAKDLPLEYKIFDYQPEPWTPIKCALLLKQMAWTLTGYSNDRIMSLTRSALGEELMQRLYPIYPPEQDPIMPTSTPWNFQPNAVSKPSAMFRSTLSGATINVERTSTDGSNNWAVSGSKTASGYPILCNDPHLALTLPSIWYEMQLVSPEVNVYGVTLPGTPAVIIGFNQSIAWGVTNAGSDVLDWFEIKFKDAKRAEYFYNGAWQVTQQRIEEIKVRGAATVRDTLIYTHHGPVPYREKEKPFNLETPAGAAMRWTAHDASREMMTFLQLNRARNYEEYVAAIANFDCPAQNFVFADTAGDIAIWHNGKFPLRWQEQGKYISDGSDPAYDWQGWVPRAEVPHVKNPERGFVSSANQSATDLSYPYYLGSDYAAFERGARINEYLAAKSQITPQDMMALQNDAVSLFAQKVLPRLLETLPAEKLDAEQREFYEMLKSWNYEYRAELAAPLIFNTWWRELYELIWKDDMKIGESELKYPRRDVTMSLVLNEPTSSFYDIKNTPQTESLAELTLLAFQNMQSKLAKEHGAFGASWHWEKARGTDVGHLARIPGLGRMQLPTSGNGDNVNATTKTHGPSWRMIVALGPQVQAWGLYPGGQSGEPGSRFYDNMVDDWVAGKYYELLYLKTATENDARIAGKTSLLVSK